MKRILILYTAVGLGHKAIAENISYHLERVGYEVRLANIQQVEEGPFANAIAIVHSFINRHLPFVWGWLYRWGHYVILPFRVFIAGFDFKNTKKLIDDFDPAMVISTQTSSSAVIAYLKRKGLYKGPFGITFCDYHLHPYWLYPEADFYIANIEEQRHLMLARGVPASKIFICGMTLQPKQAIDIASVKARLGVTNNEKVVLVASGSLGIALPAERVLQLVDSFEQASKSAGISLKIVVACGLNKRFYQQLAGKLGNRAVVLPYHKPWTELCAIADIFLTKPGGLTIAEGLQWNLPMLITHWLPGQEKLNYEYLQKNGLVMPGPANPYSLTIDEIVSRVIAELQIGIFRAQLANNKLTSTLPQGEPPVPAFTAVSQMFDVHKTMV
jgi:processive 1,2-diacylglycerol beta-glucosyltransferase